MDLSDYPSLPQAGNDPLTLALEYRRKIKRENDRKEAALHKVAYGGYNEKPLTKGASIEATGKCAETPLHPAVRSGHSDAVELLLSKGASIEAVDEGGNTPLHLAASSGHTNIVEILLRKGALIEAMNKDNDTPLHLASRNGHTSVVELLLSKAAPIEAIN